jgi:hypothetical protein
MNMLPEEWWCYSKLMIIKKDPHYQWINFYSQMLIKKSDSKFILPKGEQQIFCPSHTSWRKRTREADTTKNGWHLISGVIRRITQYMRSRLASQNWVGSYQYQLGSQWEKEKAMVQ